MRVDTVGQAQSRRPVVAIGTDERPVCDRAIPRLNQRVGGRIEVRQVVVPLPLRGRKLVADAGVHGQVVPHAPVILQVEEMHALPQVEHGRIHELVAAARSHEEVGQVVGRRIGRGAGGTAELPGVRICAVLRVYVVDFGVDGLVLVSRLQRMRAGEPRVVETCIDRQRVLILRIAALPAPGRPAAHALLRQPAGKHGIGRQAGDAIAVEHVGTAGAERALAGVSARQPEPQFEQRPGRKRVRDTQRQLLVEHVHVCVRGTARLAWNGWRLEVVNLAVAEAHETRRAGSQLLVDLDVELVVVFLPARQGVVVVAGPRGRRKRKAREHLGGEGRDGRLRNHAVGVDVAGQRVDDRLAHHALALRRRGNTRKRGRALNLPEPLVVDEEEDSVGHDRSAEDGTELVALHGRLSRRRLEVADGVHRRVPVELPRRATELVGPAAKCRIDDRATGSSVLGREVVRLNLEFLDGVG